MKNGFTTDPDIPDFLIVIIGVAFSALCIAAGAAFAFTITALLYLLF